MATTLVTREDSDGYEHSICAQDQVNTCAAASLFMIECLVKQATMAGGEDGVRRWFGRGESTWSRGMSIPSAAAALKAMGCKVRVDHVDTRRGRGGARFRLGRMGDQRPALVVVDWLKKSNSTRSMSFEVTGSHAVVARWFTDDSSRVVILDPWRGALVELLNDGNYSGPSGDGVISDIIYT